MLSNNVNILVTIALKSVNNSVEQTTVYYKERDNSMIVDKRECMVLIWRTGMPGLITVFFHLK